MYTSEGGNPGGGAYVVQCLHNIITHDSGKRRQELCEKEEVGGRGL